MWRFGAISRLRWRSRKASRERLDAVYKIVRYQSIGKTFASTRARLRCIVSTSNSNLRCRAALLLSRAPIVEREMPPPDARSCCLFNRAATKSAFAQCACQWSEITANLQEPCTRPICMHAKISATSVTCGVRGRGFYLGLFPSRCIATASTLPFARHCIMDSDVVRSGQFVWLIARMEHSRRRKCSKRSATGVQRRCQRTTARLRLSCTRCAHWRPRIEPIS